MKNKKSPLFTILSIVSICIIFSSCITSQSTRREVTAAGLHPNQVNMIITPITADLDVKQTKIEYTNNYKTSKTEEVKKFLLADAALMLKADLIVAPQFNIEIISNPEATFCIGTVYGYPASFVNFRKATESDCQSIHLHQSVERPEATKENTKQPIQIFKNNK